MLQISRSGVVVSGSEADIARARADFEKQDWVRLPAILDRDLFEMAQSQLGASQFEEKTANLYKELTVADNALPFALLLLLNNARLFKLIEEITGCGHIGCFRGRIYRIVPGANHHVEWHTDLNETRLVALSVNLSSEPYEGGVLSIREAETERVLCELTNSGFGDAILFRIDERLQHRVSDVEGTFAKTALAGWFESAPNYRTLLGKSDT
ncbi:MAG TPA: 2OG-Fe(II) oxygenase [Pyrinomonadaceae bacterium]|nr:2OG-Fe(II) oxygenase [Pyrinomonadaceae bacterium]